jgi:ABC-type multidrug transport system ATPase subunit
MDEIEHISDDIAIIDEGRIILHDRKEAVLTHTGKVSIQVESLSASLCDRLKHVEGLQIGPKGILVDRNERFHTNMTQLFTLFEQEHVEIKDMTFGYKNLEDLFLTLTSVTLRDR